MAKTTHARSEQIKLIKMLIDNEALLPMRSAVGTLDWLEALTKTIHDIAGAPISSRGDHNEARRALLRIASLAEVAAYLASDFGNMLDCAREQAETLLPNAINEVMGGDDGTSN